MKIVSVVGARPQFVKASVVSLQLRSAFGSAEVLVHTGQHYDDSMSAVFFQELQLPDPHYHLGVGSGSHGEQTGRMLAEIERVLERESPDWVLVYGDTNSTIAGALAAAKLHIPVAHVEAGLRSFNRRMPEEVNRVLTDHLAELLFVPTEAAVANLLREGVAEERIHLVGDVMYDAALMFGERASMSSDVLTRIGVEAGNYVLATVHRAENTDNPDRLRAIIAGLNEISRELPVVLPLHPRTRHALSALGLNVAQSTIDALRITEPLGYLDMLMLEKNARLIATDSGGVQKEAFFHRVRCVTLRDETEWVELVELGWNTLLSPDSPKVVAEGLRAALSSDSSPDASASLYGDARASERVAAIMGGVA
jgi:UDP-GlcNAc3NAcA epimerase